MKQMTSIGKLFSKFKNSGLMQIFSGKQQATAESAGNSVFKQMLGNVKSTQSVQKSTVSTFGKNVNGTQTKNIDISTSNVNNSDSNTAEINTNALKAENTERVRQFIINPAVSVKTGKDESKTVVKNDAKTVVSGNKSKSASNDKAVKTDELSKTEIIDESNNQTTDEPKKSSKAHVESNTVESPHIVSIPNQVQSDVTLKNSVSIFEKQQLDADAKMIDTVESKSVEKSYSPLQAVKVDDTHGSVKNIKGDSNKTSSIPVIKQENQNSDNNTAVINNNVKTATTIEKSNQDIQPVKADAKIVTDEKLDNAGEKKTTNASIPLSQKQNQSENSTIVKNTIIETVDNSINLKTDEKVKSIPKDSLTTNEQKISDSQSEETRTVLNNNNQSIKEASAFINNENNRKSSTVSVVERIRNNSAPIVQNNDNETSVKVDNGKTIDAKDVKDTTVVVNKPVQDNSTVKNDLQASPKVENIVDNQISNKLQTQNNLETKEIKSADTKELIKILQNNGRNEVKAESLRMSDPAIESVSYSKSENVTAKSTDMNNARIQEIVQDGNKSIVRNDKVSLANSESKTRNVITANKKETLVPDNSKIVQKADNKINIEPTVKNTVNNKADVTSPSIQKTATEQNQVPAENKSSVQSVSTDKQIESVKPVTDSVKVNTIKTVNTKPVAVQQNTVESKKIDTVTSNNSNVKVESIPEEIKTNIFADTEINKLAAKREMKLMTYSKPESIKTNDKNTDVKSVSKNDQGVDTKNVITKIKQFIVKSNQSDNVAKTQPATPLVESKSDSVSNVIKSSVINDENKIQNVSTPAQSVVKAKTAQVKNNAVSNTTLNQTVAEAKEQIVANNTNVNVTNSENQKPLTVLNKSNPAKVANNASIIDNSVQVDESNKQLITDTDGEIKPIVNETVQNHKQKNTLVNEKSDKKVVSSKGQESLAVSTQNDKAVADSIAKNNTEPKKSPSIVDNLAGQKKESVIIEKTTPEKATSTVSNKKVTTTFATKDSIKTATVSVKSENEYKTISHIETESVKGKSNSVLDEKPEKIIAPKTESKYNKIQSQDNKTVLQNQNITEINQDNTKSNENTILDKTATEPQTKVDTNKTIQSRLAVPNTRSIEASNADLKETDNQLSSTDSEGKAKSQVTGSMIAKIEKNVNETSQTVEQSDVNTTKKQVSTQTTFQSQVNSDKENVENKHVYVAPSENKSVAVNKSQSNSNQSQTGKPVTLVTEKAVTEDFQKDMGSNEQNLSDQSNFKGQTVFSNSAVNNATFSSQMNATLVASKSELSYLSQQIHEGYEMLLTRNADEKLSLSARTAELGLIRIELTKQDNDVQVVLKVQSEQSQRMLEQAMPELRQTLSKSQIQVQELRIVYSENSDQQDASRQHAFNRQRQEQQNNQNNSAISKSRNSDKQYTEFQSVYETLA